MPSWPKSIPYGLSPTFTREHVHELLNSVLKKPLEPSITDKLLFRSPVQRKPNVSLEGFDNPYQQVALQDIISQYPEAISRIRNITLGGLDNRLDTVQGTYHPMTGNIKTRGGWDKPSNYRFPHEQSMGILRHELSHAMGLKDTGPSPNAYDISNLSDLLYLDGPTGDVELPSEPKGLGPSSKVKIRK